MNTVTQTALGILILGAAFIFGNQMRKASVDNENQLAANSPDQPEFVWQKPPYQPGQTNLPTVDESDSNDGLIDMPVAKKRGTMQTPSIPKPAKLTLPSDANHKIETSNDPTAQSQTAGYRPTEPSVERSDQSIPTTVEPDFSKLAQEFFASQETPKFARRGEPRSLSAVAPKPTQPADSAPQINGPMSTAPSSSLGDLPPPPNGTQFAARDFEPQLRSATPTPTASRIAPSQETDSDSNITPESTSQHDSRIAANPERSVLARPGAIDSVESKELSSPGTNRIVPFGLTDQAKQNLVNVRSRQTNGFRVETNRFIRHRAKAGESLQQVSKKYFGKPDYYLDIYLVNQDVLTHPGRVPQGVSLKIPVFD